MKTKLRKTTRVVLTDNDGYKVEILYYNDDFVVLDRYINDEQVMSLTSIVSYLVAKKYLKKLLENNWEIQYVIS